MPTRRSFVSSVLGAGVSLPVMRQSAFRQLFHAEPIAAGRAAVNVAEDETYWREIQRAFDLDRTMVNLNNGGCSPAPTHVLEQMIRDLRFSNELRSITCGACSSRASSPSVAIGREFGATPRRWRSRATRRRRSET